MRAVPRCPVIDVWTEMPSTDAAELAAREGHRGMHWRGGKLRRAEAGFDCKQRRASSRRDQPAVVSATAQTTSLWSLAAGRRRPSVNNTPMRNDGGASSAGT